MFADKNDNRYSAQLRENDAAAWQHFIHSYYPLLYRVANKIVKDTTAAEDITTEVFVNVWQKRVEFENEQHFKNYLYTSIRNACLNTLRSKQREEVRNKTFVDTYMQSDESFENEIIYSEVLAEIRKEIGGLPPRMRQVFIMAYFQQMSNEEIAEKLNLSNQTVRNQKASALTLLRKQIKPKFSLKMLSMVLFA